MQLALTLASALFGLAVAAPQGVTETLTPTGAAPAGCTGTVDGNFEITVAKVTEEKRSLPEKRDECGAEGVLVLSLSDGATTDAQGRTGYIASNYQFQFDGPPQAGALVTSGFSVCKDNTLALGDSKTFYQCLSGDFYNLYDRSWAAQCEPVSLLAIPCGSKDSATQDPDGQVVGTTVVTTTIITALSDGQPQVVTTKVPVTIYSTYAPVSEHSDGQIQVTPTGTGSAPVSTPAETESASTPVETTSEVIPPATSVSATATVSASSSSAAASTSVSVPLESPPVTSSPVTSSPATSSPVTSSPITSSAAVSSSSAAASTSSAPPATTSAPPTGGSSHVAAGSMGALVVGMVVAFLCL
ncbi:hypothetical protein F4678DRAFT_202792 [Xylaria arbuscula]|nr:hypothetical protein F4678DRAFT_202792 [Xylaria arbuscula]